jgi:uncharacterized protein (TIGR02421 family)
MLKLSIDQIIQKISREEIFEAVSLDQSLRIKIQDYLPYVCTAIHNGHNMRPEILEKCALSDYERWYEEDPFTVDFITSFPIVFEGLDSRYEYDLNRTPESAVMEVAWGKQVWNKPLSQSEKALSIEKHQNFYRVVEALAQMLEKKFGAGIIYDIHSYNYKRHKRETPVFNIGTERINQEKFGKDAEKWRKELLKIEIPHVDTTSKINDVFFGRGYQLQFVGERFQNVLVLATEVKKVFCDELSGESFPLVINAIHEGFKKAVLNHASYFIKRHGTYSLKRKTDLLGGSLNKSLLDVDKRLYKLVKGFELLEFVNPVNMEQQRRKFYQSGCEEAPQFRYRPIEIDALELKRKLVALPVENIRDVDIQHMYRDVIQAYMDKIDMLSTLGTDKFLYNSLRYFGEPSTRDIDNARFLLYCPPFENLEDPKDMGVEEATDFFTELGRQYGFDFKIKISERVVSPATVLNSKKMVVLKKGAAFSRRSLTTLGHHEIGVHMVTTMNSNLQPLKVFNIGLPRNTMTQEGLAVLSELLCGNFRYTRMRELGFRVFAVRSVVEGDSFPETFELLYRNLGMEKDAAFNLSTRVHRGGGFTKEHLYLNGFKRILKMYKNGESLDHLLIGKTSLDYLSTIDEMIARGLLQKPKYITQTFSNPEAINPNLDYVLSGLR